MRFKSLFAASLILITGTSFAKLLTPITAMPKAAACGNPPIEEQDPQWCSCFSNFLIQICKDMGGDQDECTDAGIRRMIQEYGGSSVICGFNPDPDMDPKTCEDTLNYYFQCPIKN